METKDVVDYLQNYGKQLLEKRERLMRPLQELDQEIEHVSATVRALQKTNPSYPRVDPQLTEEFPIGKLRRLTQVQALIVIAKHYNGTIRAQEAKRLLIKAGVMRETKNSTNIIHSVILRSDKFSRIAPGEYRLKEEAPSKTKDEGLFHTPVQ